LPSGDQSINGHVLLLTYAMTAGHRLDIILWIPIAIKDDTRIRRCKINSNATGSSGKQEYKAFSLSVKPIDRLLTIVARNTSVEALARIFPS
jgi:hypothetical protein